MRAERKTNSSGEVMFSELDYGTYEIFETSSGSTSYPLSAQDGYNASEGWVEWGEVEINSATTKVKRIRNKKARNASLKLTKKDPASGENLKGVKFKLYYTQGSEWINGTFTTNADGEIVVNNLKPGTYEVYETQTQNETLYPMEKQIESGDFHQGSRTSPIDTTKWVFTTHTTTVDSPAVINMNNYSAKGKLTITKKDSNNGNNLNGVKIKLYSVTKGAWVGERDYGYHSYQTKSGNDAQEFTIQNGKLTINKLEVGRYEVYETQSSDSNLYPLNMQPGRVIHPHNSIGDWVLLDTVNINEDAETKIDKTNTRPNDGTLTITKKDSNNENNLNGAKFKLYSVTDGSWVLSQNTDGTFNYNKNQGVGQAKEFEITSDGTITIDKLRRGEYEIYETQSPNETLYPLSKQAGYGANTRASTYAYIGKRTVGGTAVTVDINNTRPNDGTLTITKQDKDTKNKLNGAKFILYSVTDGSWSAEYEITSNGTITINNLRRGEYEIYETQSPNDTIYPLSKQSGYGTSTRTGTSTYAYIGKRIVGGTTVTVDIDNTRPNDGIITITKQDQYTKEKLNGAKFKLYSVTDGSWVLSKNTDGTFNYNKNQGVGQASEFEITSSGTITIDKLRRGEYEIYETRSPDETYYPLRRQPGYGQNTRASTYAYIDKMTVGGTTVTVDIDNTRPNDGEIQIEKRDETYNALKLAGAEFKIYSIKDNAWLNGNANSVTYTNNISNAKGFATGSDGKLTLEKIRYGKYKIYESKTPVGYDITKQNGYMSDDVSKNQKWIYLGETDVTSSSTTVQITADNKKIISLEGKVWEDIPYNKDTQKCDYMLYDGDKLLDGITVYLCDKDGNIVKNIKGNEAKDTTENGGKYKFEDLNYWDVANYYVTFNYDNVKYITVNPFTGSDNTRNSKAQEYTVTAEKLDDSKLTGTDGAYPGRAVTYKDKANQMNNYNDILNNTNILTNYYNTGTYTIENINLGLMEKKDPNYSIKEELAYIKIALNGYTYTYNYDNVSATNGTNGGNVIESLYVPTTSSQTLTGGYTAQVYPSDVAYNAKNGGNQLKLYVVYKITVSNDETENDNDKYVEQRLYLTSLTNSFDTNRYTLARTENLDDEHGSDFGLWSEPEEKTNGQGKKYGETRYNVNGDKSVYRNGIEKNSGAGMDNNAVSSYIQFRMKDDALKAILDGNYNEYHEEVIPTQTTANAYHDYLRIDKIWDTNPSVTSWRGTRNDYTLSGKKAFVHRSVDKTAKSYALYVHMKLGEPRTISGTVFEDNKNKKVGDADIGNGIYDNNENLAKNVKVELLNAKTLDDLESNNNGIADLYVKDDTDTSKHYRIDKAQTVTGNDGKYSFTGVVPGYYYLRFTYGDGTQKICKTDGTEVTDIKLNDYQSTVISSDITDVIKRANEAEETSNNKDEVEWYKYIGTNYSVAVDDLSLREKFDDNEYRVEGTIDNESNDVTNMKAFTPRTSISIENDTNTSGKANVHKSKYANFNFGIMESPKTKIDVDKIIKNLSVTTQVGNDITSGNPATSNLPYITDLDRVSKDKFNGSKAVKLEINKETLYGARMKIIYEIHVANNSEVDYKNTNNPENWYWYGSTDNASKKIVTIEEVTDYIDKKFKFDSLEKIGSTEDGITFANTEAKDAKHTIDGESIDVKEVPIKDWGDFEINTSKNISYSLEYPIGSEDDMVLYNDAQVTQIKLDKLTTLQSEFKWNEDNAVMTIVPPTGENRSTVYYVIAVISLTIVATGIVVIKKKSHNK